MNREAIYSALFTKVSSAAGFVTMSRRLKHWDDVSAANQPAIFQAQKNETPANVPGLNQVWTLSVDVYIYVHSQNDHSVIPSSVLNPLIDAVEYALRPDAVSNKQTLGGLVQHVWIDGAIETDEGVLGDQAVAIIPITIKVA